MQQMDKKRFPTLCSWCSQCITGVDIGRRKPLINPPSGYSTYCLKEHFDNDGKDKYPDKTECLDYQQDPKATLSEIEWWKIVWIADSFSK
jgi:hypothetical protein